MTQPSTRVTRINEYQDESRSALEALLDITPLATVALVRDGHPESFPIGYARVGTDLVIHGSTGSPWLRALSTGLPAAVSVTMLDGVVVARSAFESSFRYRSAALFGVFEQVSGDDKTSLLEVLTDGFIPGRVAELRPSTRKEIAATLVLKMPIGDDNWSLKVSAGWPEDPDEDVAGDAWAGVVPMAVTYGEPLSAPDLTEGIPVPASVLALAQRSVQ